MLDKSIYIKIKCVIQLLIIQEFIIVLLQDKSINNKGKTCHEAI